MIFLKNLQRYKNVIHGILERKDGSVNPFSNSKTEENILKALKKLGYKDAEVDNLIFADQVHGQNIYFCPPGVGGYIKLQTDGLITKTPGQILIIKTADCLPILIYDPKQGKVGAIHAGGEGIMKGIIEMTIKAFNSQPSSLIVGIGPHIRKCCYYLKKGNENLAQKSKLKKYIQKRKGKFYIDLTQIVIDKLLKLGVRKENIEDCSICTFCQAERFYSARKKRRAARDLSKRKRTISLFWKLYRIITGGLKQMCRTKLRKI